MDKLFNLVYDGAQKREIQNCEPLDLVKQMEDALQEIGRLCKQQEEETAFQKMENTTKALRLAYEDSNNTGYCNLLPLMEELKENMAALEKVANKEGRVPVEENETAFWFYSTTGSKQAWTHLSMSLSDKLTGSGEIQTIVLSHV